MATDSEVEHLMKLFVYGHLPEHLQVASKPFCDLAQEMAKTKPNPELPFALRCLLLAKDAYVRTVLLSSS